MRRAGTSTTSPAWTRSWSCRKAGSSECTPRYNGGAFGSPAWTTYQLEYVRDQIHRRFRIREGRRWHAIAGISMGGQGALRFASLLPGYFGSVAGLSPAFPDVQAPEAVFGIPAVTGFAYEDIFGPPDGAYATGMSAFALAPNMEHSRVYLLSGDGTNCPGDPQTATYDLDVITEKAIRHQQAPYAAELRLAGADVTTREPCGVHTFGVWTRAFADLRATWGFFGVVPEHPRRWTHRTGRRSGEMWGSRSRSTRHRPRSRSSGATERASPPPARAR